MKDQSFLPHVISFEHKPKKEVSVSVPQVAEFVHSIALKGVISKEGKFLLDPGGMVIEHHSEGVYKITHNLGYANTSLSVSILEPPGGVVVKSHHPMYFEVEVQEDAKPKDKDWCFTLMRTI
jgi:hypothetical protein